MFTNVLDFRTFELLFFDVLSEFNKFNLRNANLAQLVLNLPDQSLYMHVLWFSVMLTKSIKHERLCLTTFPNVYPEESSARVFLMIFYHSCLEMCNSRKYPYLPQGRDFFYDPDTPLEIPIKLLSFFKIFWALQNPHPPGNSNPFCGGVWIFSGTVQ